MTVPATAQSRWFTASLVRHLRDQLPDVALAIGPLTTPPASLPALVVQQQRTQAQEFLGARTDPTMGQRGCLLTVHHWVAAIDQPTAYHAAPGTLLDRLRVALAVGEIPWESEEEPGTVVQEGALAVTVVEGLAVPEPADHPGRILAAQGWSYRTLQVSVAGFLRWTVEVTP
ncbi:MAG TPA: hypothetical protein VEI97_14280 [bacterium]|nr:hypothetical protein [bacterium]